MSIAPYNSSVEVASISTDHCAEVMYAILSGVVNGMHTCMGAVPVQKMFDIITQVTPVTITNASVFHYLFRNEKRFRLPPTWHSGCR